MLLEPVWAGMMPTTDKTVEHLHDLICTLRSIVWQWRLGWSDLKRCSPLRVAVEFEGKLRLFQPDENVVQCVPVLLWETELHWLHLPRCGFLWKQESERVQLWITHTIKSRTSLTLFSDLIFEFSENLFDDTSDHLSLQGNLALDGNVQATINRFDKLHVPTADSQTPEEHPRTTFTLHSSVVDSSTTNDAAQYIGAVHASRQECVQEDLLRPGVLVLRHCRRRFFRQLGRGIRLWRRPWRRRWCHGLRSCLLRWRLHVEN
mmetsp:Transcript_61165/g.162521  ORF Transcript_61165/g.162521 Transcript_61165/m.162521 type:complete len:261 (-) Transcript_61165:3921-4703(-)